MKIRIIFGVFIVIILLLLMPSISSIQLKTIEKDKNPMVILRKEISVDFKDMPKDAPPHWFMLFYTIIMLSLQIRFEILTPLAIKDFGGYFGGIEINSYFFCLILTTLIYRFAFWYNFFDKISEKNDWDLPIC